MRVVVAGATGGIGGHLVRQASAAGHQVVALSRRPGEFGAGVENVVTDLASADQGELRRAVDGAAAVLSALGPRSAADAGIVVTGTAALVEAMRAAGVGRLVVVSAAQLGTVRSPGRPHPPARDPGDGPVTAHLLGPLVKAAFRGQYADLAVMEDLVRDSGLGWTVVRPPKLTNGAGTGGYRFAVDRNVRGGLTVSRADVAHLMLRALELPDAVGHTLGVAR